MSEIVLDTTILIDHLRGYGPAEPFIKKIENGEVTGKISMLTVAELFAGKDSANWRGMDEVMQLLDLFVKVPVDEIIAAKGGMIRRDYGINIMDAIIAATALVNGSRLYTSNLEDFKPVKGLDAESPY